MLLLVAIYQLRTRSIRLRNVKLEAEIRQRHRAEAAQHRLIAELEAKTAEIEAKNTELERFTDSLPAGIFNLDGYERFLIDFMRRRGIPSSFSRMPRKLVLVANDLDAGERAVFGVDRLRHVPVSRAVCATSWNLDARTGRARAGNSGQGRGARDAL